MRRLLRMACAGGEVGGMVDPGLVQGRCSGGNGVFARGAEGAFRAENGCCAPCKGTVPSGIGLPNIAQASPPRSSRGHEAHFFPFRAGNRVRAS